MIDLSAVTAPLALAVTAAALLAAGVALAVTRSLAVALPVLLELLVAAGLLRLTGDPDWRAVSTAAAIVALRRLIGYGVRLSRSSRSSRPAGPRRALPALRQLPSVRELLHPAWRA